MQYTRRFQRHTAFIASSFDISRRRHNISKSNLQVNRNTWPTTRTLLESLTPERLIEAAHQAEQHQPVTDPAVRELITMISRVGSTSAGSDEKKSYMLVELKSSTIYHGCPIIFITINPGDLYSPVALYYAGEKIDVKNFYPEWYDSTARLRTIMDNPLAVLEYFHNTIGTIIDSVLKGGLFGELVHHYGTIEYQGRGTPHLHLAVIPPQIKSLTAL